MGHSISSTLSQHGDYRDPSAYMYDDLRVFKSYQFVAISICVGLLAAKPPVSHTIPVPRDVETKEPLGCVV